MRKKIEEKIITLLRESRAVWNWLYEHKIGADLDAWNGILRSITIVNDDILLSLYDRLMRGDHIVPCLADDDGNYLNIKIGNCYGAIIHDGSIHT